MAVACPCLLCSQATDSDKSQFFSYSARRAFVGRVVGICIFRCSNLAWRCQHCKTPEAWRLHNRTQIAGHRSTMTLRFLELQRRVPSLVHHLIAPHSCWRLPELSASEQWQASPSSRQRPDRQSSSIMSIPYRTQTRQIAGKVRTPGVLQSNPRF